MRESQRRRHKDVGLVDRVIALDEEWRAAKFALDGLRKEFNALNKELGKRMKAKENADDLKAQSKELKAAIQAAEEHEGEKAGARDATLVSIGNLVPDSVPVHNDEDHNEVVKEWGTPRDEKLYNHVDLVNLLGIVDLEKGSEVAGGRGYYLVGAGAMLNAALIKYAQEFLVGKGSTLIQTPFFMQKDIMGECAQLGDFDEQLYKVTGEGAEKYLIATSEQPLCSMFRKTWIEPKDLPQKYAGYSTCFRKEAGSHGRDTLGIFRVHQFEKVEQFVVTSPDGDESWRMMDEMLANSEEFYQSLNVPYRVVNIVSGALNDAAAKKFDLEAWFPGGKAYRELVSCSNCTDYQSRRLEVRVRTPKGPVDAQKVYVHLLNSTLTATERTLCCLLENWQTKDGVVVPDALRPYMLGTEFLPFKFELKKGKLKPRKEIPKGPPKAAPADDGPVDKTSKAYQKKVAKCVKEGGKKGVDIAGAADMTLGLEFFCTSMEVPDGDVELLEQCMKGANKEVEPDAEERKGGSGHIGKAFFSAGNKSLAIVTYVPPPLIEKVRADEWMAHIAGAVGAEVEGYASQGYCRAVMRADPDSGKFSIKEKDVALDKAFEYLRSKGAFPEDDGDDDSDDYCFGDDALDEYM